MKIIVEEGDAFTGLEPGTYEFGAREVRMDHEVDVDPHNMRAIRNSRMVFTLRGELLTQPRFRPPTAEQQRQKFLDEYLRQPRPQAKRGGMVAEAIRAVMGNGDREAFVPRKVETCTECGGSGEWENPANGRRSPCSRGCRR